MSRFIIVSFGVLAWVFWEMSGGANFVPEQRIAAAPPRAETPSQTDEAAAGDTVTRTEGLQLVRISPETPDLLLQQASLTQTDDLLVQRAAEARAESARVIEAAEPEAPAADLREVAGSWVNLRSGPGTDYGRLTALPAGTSVEVLEVDASGWARLRVVDSDQTGWMAERLLTDADT